MERKYFSLETRENNKLTRIIQSIFGFLCIAIAVYWLIYNFKSVKADSTLWITVAFLTGFGLYLVWTGFGYGARFIEFTAESIIVKKNQFLPPAVVNIPDISAIYVYPLKVVIGFSDSKTILIRFGVTDAEKVERIKDEFIRFASDAGVEMEIRNE